MKKYRKKEEILAWQWLGDDSIINEINNALELFNDKNDLKMKVEFGYTDNVLNKNILCVSCSNGFNTSTDFARFNDYIVFDIHNNIRPFGSYNEKWFNENYIEI